jgi:hypothetical protein
VFAAVNIQIIKTPPQAPRANAIGERMVGTLRRELLDRILIVNHAHPRRVLNEYLIHCNEHRPIGPSGSGHRTTVGRSRRPSRDQYGATGSSVGCSTSTTAPHDHRRRASKNAGQRHTTISEPHRGDRCGAPPVFQGRRPGKRLPLPSCPGGVPAPASYLERLPRRPACARPGRRSRSPTGLRGIR